MGDFVQIMKDWRRMCETIQSKNQEISSGDWCKGCRVQDVCIIDTAIKDCTVNVFTMIYERIQSWAAENKEQEYPTWIEMLEQYGVLDDDYDLVFMPSAYQPIPADIAEKLGIEPKNG